MSDRQMLLLFAIVIILAIIGAIYEERQEEEKMRRKKEQAAKTKNKPVKVVPQPEDPKVVALRGAAWQNLQINLLALEAEKQMAELARLHRTDTATRRDPQSDPNYRRSEWMQNGDDWRSNRF